MQESIDITKYQALAYLTEPHGKLLFAQVNKYWNDWLCIVSKASWLKHWILSPIALSTQAAYTPTGMDIPTQYSTTAINYKTLNTGKIGLQVFIDAVWGFGIESWLEKPQNEKYTLITSTMLKNQNIPQIPRNRKELWDTPLYESCGLEIPPEYGALARW